MHLGQHAQMVTRHLREGLYRHLPHSAGCYWPSATQVVCPFHYQDKKEGKLVCSNLAVTLLFDISASLHHAQTPTLQSWAFTYGQHLDPLCSRMHSCQQEVAVVGLTQLFCILPPFLPYHICSSGTCAAGRASRNAKTGVWKKSRPT